MKFNAVGGHMNSTIGDFGGLRAHVMRGAAVVGGLCAAGVLVLQGSNAAFTASTANNGNSVASGTVVLADDDSNTAMFNVAGLNGGQVVERCIKVTYSGTLTADVKLFGTVGGTGLAPGLTATIKVGTGTTSTGGASFSCTGFSDGVQIFDGSLTAFGTSHSSYVNGLGGFANATATTTKAYKIELTVSNDNTYQGKTATAAFTWEAQGKNAA